MPSERMLAAIAAVTLLVAPAPASADRGKRSTRGPVFAVEAGVAGVVGGPDVYGVGAGRSFILGYRMNHTTFEWHFGQSFRSQPRAEQAQGHTTQGATAFSSVGVRRVWQRRAFVLSGLAGVTRVTVPLLSIGSPSPGSTVRARSLVGVGALAGAGAGIPILNGQALILVEARAAYAVWEIPEYEYVESVDTSGGTTRFEGSVDDLSLLPWTLTLSIRAQL